MARVLEDNEAKNTTSDSQKELITGHLKLDKHGLPLVPQPSDHKDDPLVKMLRPAATSY